MKALPYVALAAVAFGVRLVYLAEWHDTPLFTVLLGDGRQYDLWARRIASGDWFGREVFYQAPLYPYFLAAVRGTLGGSPWAARLVQAALGASSAVLLALAGRRFVSREAGIAAGALFALYAPAIFFDGLVQKGALDGFLVALLLWTLGELAERASPAWAAAVGLTLGAFALNRENALLLAPVLALWLVVERPRRFAAAAALLAGVALVLAPVGLRNLALGGGFLPTTSQFGANFYYGNHPDSDGRYEPLVARRGDARFEQADAKALAEEALGRPLAPREVSRYWLDRALQAIASDPGAWFGLLARKAALVWHAGEILDTEAIEAYAEASRVLAALRRLLHFGTLLPLAVAGVWLRREDWRRLTPLYAVALALAGSVALFFVMARYRYPLVPVLALFAGAALSTAADLARRRAWRTLAAPAALALATGIACNWPLGGAATDPRTITYFNLGTALNEAGRFDEARPVLERALAIDPAFADARYALGDGWLRQGDPARAATEFDAALRLAPQHPHAHTARGMLDFERGDLDGAERHFRAALQADSRLAAAHNDLAAVLVRRGRAAEALSHLERAVRLDPQDAGARENLARLRAALGAP